ncbi:hypothetical protein ES705_49995 [subsurface metagenome]
MNFHHELSSSQHFLREYLQALSKYNIEHKNDLIIFKEISIESGFVTLKKICGNKNIKEAYFSAILTLSDLLAIGIYEAAKEMHFKIPDDISY